jgi:hypothetical protein
MFPARWKALTRDGIGADFHLRMTSQVVTSYARLGAASRKEVRLRRSRAACNGRATPGPQPTVAANVTNPREARNQRSIGGTNSVNARRKTLTRFVLTNEANATKGD